MSNQRACGAIVLGIGIFISNQIFAAGTITVQGTGTVMTKPNMAEIELSIQGQDEVAGDAIKKFDQAIKQVQTAIEKLKIAELKMELQGLGITQVGQPNQAVVFNGQQPNKTKQPVNFVKGIKLSLSSIEGADETELKARLAKILDAAKDAGAVIKNNNQMAAYWGQALPNPLVNFVVEGIDEARESAYAQAIQKAKKRADRLAELAGMKVTGVKKINESFSLPVDEGSQQTRMIYAMYGMQQGEKNKRRVVSSVFKPVAVEVTLTIDFEMEKK